MTLEEQLRSSYVHIFRSIKTTGDRALQQLQDADLNTRFAGNSISTIVRHLNGNMLSRWTDMFTMDGEKPWRDRDGEFETVTCSAAEVIRHWEEGWAVVLSVLESLAPDDFQRKVSIRGQSHTLLEALHRHLQHYAYHVGQIVLIAKNARGDRWEYLSIPPGQSKEYKPLGIAGEPPIKS